MTDKRTVLVTGAAGYWGSRVAQRLLEDPELHVIGLDVAPSNEIEVEGLDYVQADIRNPVLSELLRAERVDAVCHLAFTESVRHNERVFDYNVMGTMKVIAACAVSGVTKVVWKSSTQVYGARSDNSAFLPEDAPLQANRRIGYNRYRCEIEAFINGYRRQAPEMDLTVLRFANIVGPTADTAMNRYLGNRLVPMLLGFDPMLQVIHEDDVVEALVHALNSHFSGAFNIAADPPLPLLRILALAGRVPVPLAHPLVYRSANTPLARILGRRMPFDPDFLRYRWVTDLTKMRELLGFFPQYMGNEAVETVGVHMRMKKYQGHPEDIVYDEERLLATVERRRRWRDSAASTGTRSENVEERDNG